VSAFHQPSAGTASHRSIVLLEEYEALAAAIGAALKKFAPQHATSIARSLAQAEILGAKTCPELFIIDVDPPSPGITDFLGKMRDAHPDAGVLVIGGAIPAAIIAERGSFGAVQFIEKPFELAMFEAAVQASLGPWRESKSASPRGSLRTLNPIDVVLLHYAAGANVIVDVHASGERPGEIHLTGGQVSHAETEKLTGTEALREILTWSEARMNERAGAVPARPTIQPDWSATLLEALRELKASQVPGIPITEKAVPAKPGKKIVLIDDTDMLLIFVEDVLATADPELEITTALNATDGIKQIERVNPDLVLLDYSLPDFNGDEVCRRLLENEHTARVPVLMMSAHVAEMNAAAARLENVVATIEKPFLSEALVSLVQRTSGARVRTKTVEPVASAQTPTPVRVTAAEGMPKQQKNEAPSQLSAVPPPRRRSTGRKNGKPARKKSATGQKTKMSKREAEMKTAEPSDEEVRLRAYFISEQRREFGLPGDASSDWLEAKRQLLSETGPH
jgi:DNA-binding response OmpR family regulator